MQFNCPIQFYLEVHFKYELYNYHTLQEKYIRQRKLSKYNKYCIVNKIKLYVFMMQQNSESDHKQLDLQTNSRAFRVLVGLTGSVAALKAPLLVTQLLEIAGVSVYIFKLFLLDSTEPLLSLRLSCSSMSLLFHTFIH